MNGDVTVREAMSREFVGVSEGDGVVAASELLVEEDRPAAVVLRGQRPVGLLTRADVLSLVASGTDVADATVADAMTSTVPSVSPDQSVADAAELLFTHSTGQLVVEGEGDGPLGVLTRGDVVATTTLSTAADETTATRAAATASVQGGRGNGDTFSEQGICERCESLADSLASVNGQLLCPDCRDV